MTAVDEEYKQFDNDELLANCGAFMSAGMDTTSITLAYAFYYLAMHPEKQEKARKEADSVLRDKEHISYEDYMSDKLNYVKCIMKETLRLRPPGFMIGRRASKEVQLGNQRFPKNVTASTAIY